MNADDKEVIINMTHQDAARDFAGYIEDVIAKRKLSELEMAAIAVKAEYWFLTAELKIKISVKRDIDNLRKDCRTLLPQGSPFSLIEATYFHQEPKADDNPGEYVQKFEQ